MFIFEWLSNHKLQTNAELTLFGILVFMVIIFFVIGIIWGIYNIVIKRTKIKTINKSRVIVQNNVELKPLKSLCMNNIMRKYKI